MAHFMFLDRDYKINPQWKNIRKKNTAAKITVSAMLYAALKKRTSTTGAKGGGGRGVNLNQRVMVKYRISKSLNAHKAQLSYMTREGAGIEGEKPLLQGNENEYRDNMSDLNYRIIISPESKDVDLSLLAKKLVTRLETETGFKFYWLSAEHHNTDSPHVHIAINGLDRNGKKVFISPEVVKYNTRDMASSIATEMIGKRTVKDLIIQKDNELQSNRFINIDQVLLDNTKNNVLNINQFYGDKSVYYKRLEYLSRQGLVSCDKGKFYFKDGWEESLRTAGKYNMFIDGKKYLVNTTEYDYGLYQGENPLFGIVRKVYLRDETSYSYAAVVEALDGKSYFVPFDERPLMDRGSLVKIEPVTKKNYIEKQYANLFGSTRLNEDKIVFKSKGFVLKEIHEDLQRHGIFWNKEQKGYVVNTKKERMNFQAFESNLNDYEFLNALKYSKSELAKDILKKHKERDFSSF